MIQCSRAEMHVPLRRSDVSMTGQLLDCSGRSAPHCEMRAEGVPKNVNPTSRQVRRPSCVIHMVSDLLFGRRLTGTVREHEWAVQMAYGLKRCHQSNRHWHVSQPASFWRVQVSLPK
jgi:hypothetical protein